MANELPAENQGTVRPRLTVSFCILQFFGSEDRAGSSFRFHNYKMINNLLSIPTLASHNQSVAIKVLIGACQTLSLMVI